MVSKLLGIFFGLKEKVLVGLGLLAVFFLWVFQIKRKAYKEGQKSVKDTIERDNKRVEDAWKKIDNSNGSVDESLSRLRDRSSREGNRP